MFKFLFLTIMFFVLITLLLGFSFVRSVGRLLFGSGSNRNDTQRRRPQQNKQNQNSSRKKVFKKGDGEYVDYEEVKD